MSKMARKAVAAHVLVTGFVTGLFGRMRTDERGQGSVEYLGVVIVVVLVVGAVLAVATPIGQTIATTISNKVNEIANHG